MTSQLMKRIIHNRFLQHLMFWCISWYLMLRIFTSSAQILPIDLIYTTVFVIPVAGCVYTNILLLIPWFLERKKYLPYFILQIFTMAGFAWLNMIIFSHFIDYILPGYYFISYYDYADLLKFFIAFSVITTLLKLSKGWFLLMETRSNLEKLEKEHARTELESLKSQVNPHFLFNSLNTLYSLVLKRSDTAPDYILKLSGFLRYLLYETSTTMVSLEKELEYMLDYIELQKLRAGEMATISCNVTGNAAGKRIAPLLFLPLIENSFKHGIKGETGASFVSMDVEVGNNELVFDIRNNAGHVDPVEKNNRTGIGLENLRKRLDLVYPGAYSLVKSSNQDVFQVKLIVPLQHEAQVPDR